MFNDIFIFLLQMALSLLGLAFLLRAWLYFIRMPPFNPYSQTIIQVTDWAVQPLRKLLKPGRYIDTPSVVAAWLCAVVYLIGAWWLITGTALAMEQILPVLAAAALTVLKWALNVCFWVVLLQVILSWVNPSSPAMQLLQAITRPIMEPIRRRLPATGAIDFSPLIVIIIIQVLSMVLQRLSFALIAV